ncbi:cobyrinic acid a,c-diamide synthase [compost metagenome]
MYLMEEIEGDKMVGVFKGESVMTDKLNNFGYTFIDVKENSLIRRSLKVRAHEFHKSTINSDEEKVYTLEKRAYDGSLKSWKCGYIKKNTLGAYAHIHFFSNIEFLKEIINSCKEKSRGVH